jgi:tetratricopeptide (TPR) repeat protein
VQRVVFCIAIAAAVLLCYSGVLHNGFVGYDDPGYVTDNPHVNTGLSRANFTWALTAVHSNNWHPLTWISHAVDCALFGLNPAGHHLTSLLLHALTCVLLFLWLDDLTGYRRRAAFVALAFGLHPLHVESVAWIAERKDVLSAFFFSLALLAYSAYTRKPGLARYVLVAALFGAGLLSKQMVVTLPLLLLLIDWWTGRGLHLREKVPLFALGALASAATWWVHQTTGAVAPMDQFPLELRLGNAFVSYFRYLWKTVYPVNLAVFYPMPESIAAPASLGALLAIVILTGLTFAARRKYPALLFGWLWYVITLLPVIGIVQTGMQSIADRYMYLPMVGLLIAVAWTAAPFRPATALAAVALAACAILTFRQVSVWHDGVALFAHAIEVTDRNFVAHDNLGVELDRLGRSEEALSHYREAVRIRPGDRNSESNYAQATFTKAEKLFQQGHLDESLTLFRDGIPHAPQNALAHTYAGLILMQQQRLTVALAELRLSVALDPKLARAHIALGVALAQSGDIATARKELQEALRIEPTNAEAKYDLKLIDTLAGVPKY